MKKMIFLKIAVITVISAIQLTSHAQQNLGTATIEYPQEVTASKAFKFSIIINEELPDYKQITINPDFGNIAILNGPYTSQSTSVTVNKGKTTKTHKTTYTYTLRANTGKYTIPSFKVTINSNRNYYTVPEANIISKKTGGEMPLKNKKSLNDTTFLISSLNKTIASVGEPLVLTTKLVTNGNISTIQCLSTNFDYCYFEQVNKDDSITAQSESINGKNFKTYTILEHRLRPMQQGKIILQPISVKAKTLSFGDDLVDAFFSGEHKEHEQTIEGNELIINVTQPFSSTKKSTTRTKVKDGSTLVAFDISSSMHSLDFYGSRFKVARKLARGIVDYIPNTQILPFAAKFGNIMKTVDGIDGLNINNADGTALYDIGLYALYCYFFANPYKNIVIITDGNDNSSHISAQTFANLMTAYGIKVTIIGINSLKENIDAQIFDTKTNKYETINIENNIPDTAILKKITSSTGGEYIEIKDIKDVRDAITRIIDLQSPVTKPTTPSNQFNIEEDFIKYIVQDYYYNNKLQ